MLPGGSRNSDSYSDLDRAGGNLSKPASYDSQRPVNQVTPPVENSADFEEQESKGTALFSPLRNLQALAELNPSQLSNSREKTSYGEGINAYLEQVKGEVEIFSTKHAQKEEEGDLLEVMQELNQGNMQLRTYRQAMAHRYHGQQLSSGQSLDTGDSSNGTSVTMYNQAITAYITQDLFFDNINKIGLFIRV